MTNPNLGQPVKNRFNVPTKKWARWSNHAKRVFNQMYVKLRPAMQSTLTHPQQIAMLSKEHWNTLRWNVAWEAADVANGGAAHWQRNQLRAKDGKATTQIVRKVKRRVKH